MRANLLRNLRPVSGAAGATTPERLLDFSRTLLALQEREQRRRIEDVHAASSAAASAPALGEEFAQQVQADKIRPYQFLELRTGQEHKPCRGLKQDERGALRKPCPL